MEKDSMQKVLKCLLVQIKKKPPIITVALVFSCLISTIPQLFLPELYNTLSGQYPHLSHFYFFTLPAFTHSPSMLITHLTGNLLVILLFGSLVEILIGSSRFAFISLLTFTVTLVIDYLHTVFLQESGGGHGVSGICWGYHMFFIFILIITYENKGKRVFKDIFVLILILLALFDILGIPIVEVVVLKRGFFSNFGQTLHLASMTVVVPFILLWRKEIEANVLRLLTFKEIRTKHKIISFSTILLFTVLIINLYGTARMAALSMRYSDYITYHVVPTEETDIKKIAKNIFIKFNNPMKIDSEKLVNTSINYEGEKPEFDTKWLDDKTLQIMFSRLFTDHESLKLEYIVEAQIETDLSITNSVKLEYK